jgi:hypothetical protein
VTHTCEPLARLIHTQAFEWDANSEKFVSCIHSVPQPKQPSVELPSALTPQGARGRNELQPNRRRDTYLTPRPALSQFAGKTTGRHQLMGGRAARRGSSAWLRRLPRIARRLCIDGARRPRRRCRPASDGGRAPACFQTPPDGLLLTVARRRTMRDRGIHVTA